MGRKLTQEEVKQRLEQDPTYDYSRVIYKGSRENIEIVCPTHGSFWQSYHNRLKGQKCPKCAIELQSKRKKRTKQQFLSGLTEDQLNKYDFSHMTDYSNNSIQTFGCPIHGKFNQRVRNFINSNGCGKCGRDSFKEKVSTKGIRLLNLQIPENISIKVSPDQICPLGEKVECACSIHGSFYKTGTDLIGGRFCPKCRFRGYSKTDFINHCEAYGKQVAILYIIHIYNDIENFIKIGITSKSVKERFRKFKKSTGYGYKILKEVVMKPKNCWEEELKFKNKFTKYRYTPKIKFAGYTECFEYDKLKTILDDFTRNERLT